MGQAFAVEATPATNGFLNQYDIKLKKLFSRAQSALSELEKVGHKEREAAKKAQQLKDQQQAAAIAAEAARMTEFEKACALVCVILPRCFDHTLLWSSHCLCHFAGKAAEFQWPLLDEADQLGCLQRHVAPLPDTDVMAAGLCFAVPDSDSLQLDFNKACLFESGGIHDGVLALVDTQEYGKLAAKSVLPKRFDKQDNTMSKAIAHISV